LAVILLTDTHRTIDWLTIEG